MNRSLPIWLLFLMALAGSAAAQSLDLTRTRLPGGGGASAGGQFTLFSTVGQAEAGPTLAGGAYGLDTAFLSAAIDSSIPTVVFAHGVVTVLEDAGMQTRAAFTTYLPGQAGEPAQPPTYQVANNNGALFSTPPAIATDRTLTFTPAPNASGSATVTVVARVSGVDMATNSFSISVTPVNDAPSVTLAGNVTVLEDAGAQSLAAFAGFTAGPPDESAQTPAYTLTTDNAALFAMAPAIAADGTLTFTAAANANGSAIVTVVTSDGGGTDNGGVDRTTNAFTLSVTAVNDAPGVTLAQSTVTVLEDAGAQSLAGFATFTPGPANESAQTLMGYTVSHNNSALFSAAPALAANGTLTFTPAANANGSATVTVVAQDNGGTTDGGVDRSTNIFTIIVTAVNDAPSVVFSANPVVLAVDSGPQTFTSFATFTAGPPDEAAQTPAYAVTTDNAALFSAGPAIAANGTLTFTTATGSGGTAAVTVVVQDNGGIAGGGVDKATNTFTISVLTFAGVADSYTVAEDGTLAPAAGTGVLANDIGPALRAVLVATTTNGALALNLDGSFTYQPATNFFGTDHFTYLATNSANTSAVTVVTITVRPVTDAPGVTFAQSTVTVLEDAGAQTVSAFAAFSPGPANESAQTLVGYTVSVDNATLFTTPPAIDNAGVLTFTSAPDANGSATVTVVVQDTGGTADGGVDKSTNTFTISVTPVNDAPSFTLAQSAVTVLEDAGMQTVGGFTTFSPGPVNESAQALVGYTVTVNNASLFSAAPAINNTGVLTFTPAANANGSATVTVVAQDSGGTAGGGVDKATNTFTINVTPVNDAPAVTFAQSVLTVLEDAGAQSLSGFAVFSPGPANESAQALVGYTVTVDNAALFSAAPAVANNGTLTFTPAANANGSATVTVVVQDNGGTADGGVDKSTNTFVISVTPVNDAPSVTFVQGTVTVLEDAGAQSLAGFATFSPGPANESAQTLVGYTLTVDNAGLFSAAPAIDNNGRLTFTPAANSNGIATVTVVVQDSGGTGLAPAQNIMLPGGVDKSTNTFTISVMPVNDAPSVTFAQSMVTVLEDAGAQTLAGFATFLAGPPNEAAQTLVGYTVTADNAGLFSAAPVIDNNGRLTFTSALNANGSALVTVVVRDDGGTANGGVDRSTNTFTIVVTPVNDAPVANNDSYTLDQGDVLTVGGLVVAKAFTQTGVLANDTDIENDALTATKLTDPAHGTVVLSANGGFTYTPDTNFFGTDTFTYRASDYGSNSNPATVSILVYARPTNAVPPLQRVFSSTVLRFSATNMPEANPLRVGDPDSTVLTVSLTVTNGTLAVTNLGALAFADGTTNGTNLVFTGTIADLNAALEGLTYRSKPNYFGDDALVIVSTDEGGRTNRGRGLVPILVEIPALGGVPKVSLENLNDPLTGRMITNVTMIASDTNLVKEITFNPTNSEVNVLAVGGQDGSTNRSTITVKVKFSDGTEQDVVVPVIIYQPLLTSTTNEGAYNATFGTPIFNPQTSLYEQKVSVVNNTPFDFTALRITATNLPAGVTLRNASVTNGGLPYIEYNLAVRSGSNVTLTLEYYNVNRAGSFSPGLKLELLNQSRVIPPPTNPVMTAVTGRRGYAPDGRVRFYIEFPTEAGLTYYVQYQDAVGDPWKTSPVIIPGTGNRLNWLDEGAPNTDSPPTAARFYRIVTGQ